MLEVGCAKTRYDQGRETVSQSSHGDGGVFAEVQRRARVGETWAGAIGDEPKTRKRAKARVESSRTRTRAREDDLRKKYAEREKRTEDGGKQEGRGVVGGRGDGVRTVTRGGNELWAYLENARSVPVPAPVPSTNGFRVRSLGSVQQRLAVYAGRERAWDAERWC